MMHRDKVSSVKHSEENYCLVDTGKRGGEIRSRRYIVVRPRPAYSKLSDLNLTRDENEGRARYD